MTIGVIGAKGGVGTTTLALNMGAALVQARENPVVADFRLGNGTLGLLMGLGRSQGMANVLSKPTSEIRPASIEPEVVAHQTGLRALLSSARPKEAQINAAHESVLAIVRGLREIGKPAVFDLGSGYNQFVSRLQKEMDKLILVVEPNRVSLTVARELIIELSQDGQARINIVVVNRAQSSLQTPWHEVEQILGQELRAIISAAPELTFQAA
jgi:pilus assembly protein CpaE